jgi:hypothetical protein
MSLWEGQYIASREKRAAKSPFLIWGRGKEEKIGD